MQNTLQNGEINSVLIQHMALLEMPHNDKQYIILNMSSAKMQDSTFFSKTIRLYEFYSSDLIILYFIASVIIIILREKKRES